jgi:hypothetical protein
MGIEADEPTLDPKHALANIRTLVRAAADSDDPEAVRKILKEVLRLVDKALPRRRRTD